jgi:regulatory protein
MEHEITAVQIQKRNKNRVNIHLDGEFEFGLTKILAAGLHVGRYLTDEQIENLKRKDTYEVAYARALKYIAFRPRTTDEVRKKLTGLEIDPKVVDATLERLQNNNLLEDGQFARNWVENRVAFKPRGRRLLSMELQRKGLKPDVIESSMENLPTEEELAFKAAEKYAHRLQNLEWKQFHDRLAGFLLRRGFNYMTANSAVTKVWKELN